MSGDINITFTDFAGDFNIKTASGRVMVQPASTTPVEVLGAARHSSAAFSSSATPVDSVDWKRSPCFK